LYKKLSVIVLFLLTTGSLVYSQQDVNNKIFNAKITFKDTLLVTGDKFIVRFSEIIKIGTITLTPAGDYSFDSRNGNITLSRDLFGKYSLDTNRIYDINAQYDIFPYNLKDEYSNFDIIVERDTLSGDTVQIATQRKDLIENLFEGTDLEKSGSIFRGFTFGSNKDVTLNSGFRLQLNGRLAKDVEIVAALTDENTPIQPEGNTTKLQELDKVFIELRSNNITATIGDIEVSFPKSEFLNFSRKIKGAKGYGEFNFGNTFLSGAVSRGKFNTNKFNGIDGVQGPYRLTGADNEINIVVLSGTEKIYIDGIQMTRGEQADYVIDYGLGQITFTNKRLITSEKRISVDFEYSDRKYSRTLLTGFNKFELFKKKLSIGIGYINESDNKDKAIDFTLSDSDRVILSNAGDDRNKAIKSGVTNSGRDSTGRGAGIYVLVKDSVINTDTVSFYRYAPGDSNAVYNITFSFVGQGKGDYINISTYQYKFAGKNQGSFAPVVFIPVPTGYQVASLNINYASSKNKEFYFDFESAYSYFDKNKFSPSADSRTGGAAFNSAVGLNKNNFKLFGQKFQNINFSIRERIINKTFNSLDRINSVEFNRDFDVQDSLKVTEELSEANLNIAPSEIMNLKANYSRLNRGDFFNSNRLSAVFEFNNPLGFSDSTSLPKIRYMFEKTGSDNSLFGIQGNWIKHNALISYKKYFRKNDRSAPVVDFGLDFNSETKKNTLTGSTGDSLRFDSFAFDELTPRISINNIYDFSIYAELGYRKDDFVSAGNFTNLSNSYSNKFGLTYYGVSWFSSMFDLTIRNKYFSDAGRLSGNTDNKSVLVNSRTRFEPLRGAVQTDLFYNISSERTAKIEKVFVLVSKGQGNYIYLGDLNNNGIQDENEFQLVNYDGTYIRLNIPTDQFFPTVDLKTSARVYIKPSKYFYIAKSNIIADILNNISSETSYKVEEKSKDPETSNLYYLRFSTFLNDSNTVVGNQTFQQDLNFFENNPAYSLRLRFIQLSGMSQFSSGNERLLNITKSLRFQFGLTKDLVTQAEYINKTDRNLAPPNSIRNRNIISDEINNDLSYKPFPKVESGFVVSFKKATDYYPKDITVADINQQLLRVIFSFESAGRLRLELERNEVLLNSNPLSFPYELTAGRVAGKSYFWRSIFDYGISKNIQASINYEGRVEGNRNVIHSGKAQVTAFF